MSVVRFSADVLLLSVPKMMVRPHGIIRVAEARPGDASRLVGCALGDYLAGTGISRWRRC